MFTDRTGTEEDRHLTTFRQLWAKAAAYWQKLFAPIQLPGLSTISPCLIASFKNEQKSLYEAATSGKILLLGKEPKHFLKEDVLPRYVVPDEWQNEAFRDLQRISETDFQAITLVIVPDKSLEGFQNEIFAKLPKGCVIISDAFALLLSEEANQRLYYSLNSPKKAQLFEEEYKNLPISVYYLDNHIRIYSLLLKTS